MLGLNYSVFPKVNVTGSKESPFFVTDQGIEGALFEVPLLDLEDSNVDLKFAALRGIFEELDESVLFRFQLNREMTNSSEEVVGVRRSEIGQIGYLTSKALISFERNLSKGALGALLGVSRRGQDDLIAKIPSGSLNRIGARRLVYTEVEKFFDLPSQEWKRDLRSIDQGSKVLGCVRIYKPGNANLDRARLMQVLDEIRLPYRLSVSVRKVSKAKADLSLRMQANRQAALHDAATQDRVQATEDALRATQLQGESLFELEWLLFIERTSESELRRDLEQARSALSGFGDCLIETYGLVPSFRASFPGSPQHSTFKEMGSVAPLYLPIFTMGAAAKPRGESERSIHFHRVDGSLHAFDLFDKKYLAYNALITGKSGSGKSVLANLVSQSLLADPNVLLIKVDVGGSYRKECELFGGQEINFSLDRPSGVDPFLAFSETKNSNLALETLKQFLATLVKEEGETDVSKEIHAGLEEALIQYRESLFDGEKASLDGLLETCPNIPRRKLLGRWAKGGVFSNALMSSGERPESNYRYYNFENILGASSRDYAEGVMAAVIAQVNLEMLKAGDRLKNPDGKRIVLFCDETRFFIERNAEFFLLTTANFRKFGHGVILINQNMKNFELPGKNGERDLGIILNSPIRFLLQADHEPKYLKEQFGLCDEHISILTENPYRGREYREVILQDDTGTRALRVYLTPSEYWRCTSDSEDNQKLFGLMRAVPGLTLREAINCLSRG